MKRTTALALFQLLILASSAADDLYVELVDGTDGVSVRDPSLYVSQSVEWDLVGAYFGHGAKPWTSMLHLLNNLKNLTGGSPMLRIGGNSADYSEWNPSGRPSYSANVTYNITRDDMKLLKDFSGLTGSKLILGLNFLDPNSPALAVEHAKAIAELIGWGAVDSLEIGNEPDLYASNGLRPKSFTPAQYQSQFDTYAKRVLKSLRGKRQALFQGGALAGFNGFKEGFPAFMKAEKKVCVRHSVHAYPLTACNGRKPTVEQLLEDSSCAPKLDAYASLVAAAQKTGRTLSLGETNSVSCSGAAGVSDTLAASLWALDWTLNTVRNNLTGLFWHSHPGGAYNFAKFDKNGEATVQPLYYAMYFFSILSNGSFTLVRPEVTSSNGLVKTHCVKDNEDGSYRCLILHKDLKATRPTNVTLSWYQANFPSLDTSHVLVTELRGDSPYNGQGLRAAGQTFNKDGVAVGEVQWTKVQASRKKNVVSFRFDLAPTSAVIVKTIVDQ